MNDQPVDQQALALTHAIALQESENDGKPNYNAVGDAGTSKGAYQWQPGNFEAAAKAAGLDPNDFSPANQDKVAYSEVKAYKDKGYDPGQIASLWNSGSPNNWQNHVGTTTINGTPIHYDTPAYVKGVQKYYQQLTGSQGTGVSSLLQQQDAQPTGSNPLLQPQDDSSKLDQQIQQLTSKGQTSQKPGFIQDLSTGNFGGAAVDAGNFLFPSVADTYHDIKGDSTKTGLQQLGDAGSTALGVASLVPGLDEVATPLKAALGVDKAAEGAELASKAAPGLLSQVGKNAALGGAYGVTGAVGNGDTDPTKIAESGLVGAGTGGVIGAAGSLVQKVADTLPQRLVQGVIKNSNPDVAEYALTKSMGSPAKMLADSNTSLKTIGSQLGAALTHEGVANVVVPSEQIVPKILEAFPNAELSPEQLQLEIGKVAPLQKRLITKLFSGDGLTIDELHTLNSAIGQNTYKMAFDDPMVKAGKAIGNAFYQASKQIITNAAPDTAPLFDQYSKEIQLNGALSKVAKRGVKAQALTLKDIMALMGGFTALGPAGAMGAFGLERAATSPTVNLQAAGLLNKAAQAGVHKVTPAATVLGTGLLNQLRGQMGTS